MENKLQEDLLFGTEGSLVIQRIGKQGRVLIGGKSLFGVTEMTIKVTADKPIEYCIKGEVVN